MDPSDSGAIVAFGAEMREKHFTFAAGYHPLNHGSFGTFAKSVLEYQRQLQAASEARPDTWIRYTYLELLRESRSAIASLLGAQASEVVLVPNATTGVNTVLHNLAFQEGDVILTFSTIYGACNKVIQRLSELCPVSSHQIEITYPIPDDEIVARFSSAIQHVRERGKRPTLAIFDTVLTFPGVCFPWERLVAACKEQGIRSLIDGAHGIGHIDLTHLSSVDPDFMISNCYKWLMVPRGCAVLYVPRRNHHLITSTLPTSWGYLPKPDRSTVTGDDCFDLLFNKVSTIDNTPYCCIPKALEFRSQICGGESNIRKYCFALAEQGAARMAEMLSTEAMETDSRCCFAMVRLPLTLADLSAESDGVTVARWMQELTPAEYETYIPIKFYDGQFWCRISAQIYLTIIDFEWAAATVLKICDRAKSRFGNGQGPALV